MNICFSTDINESKYLHVVINSILKNTKSPENIFFFILVDNDESIQIINQNITNKNNVNLKILHYNDKKFILENMKVLCNYSSQHISNVMNFARFFLPFMFNIDEFLYLDVDIIVKKDIFDLKRETDLIKFPLWAVHNVTMIFSDEIKEKYSIIKNKYFNAGVMYIDSKYWRENNITEKCKNIMIEHKNSEEGMFKLGTQPILNIIFNNISGSLDEKWNLNELGFNPSISREKLDDTYILHWAGKQKPWKKDGLYKNEWYEYL